MSLKLEKKWGIVLCSGILSLMAALGVANIAEGARRTLQVVLTTDKAEYQPGEMVTVGVTAGPRGLVRDVTKKEIRIADAAGTTVLQNQLVGFGDGVFSYDYLLPANALLGNWTVEVFLRTRRAVGTAQGSFTVAAFCPDADGDGFTDASCGGPDCDDGNNAIHPNAEEVCSDGIDQDCDGLDPVCGEPHSALVWNGPGTCLECHSNEAHEVHASVMYQWEGDTPYMTNQPGVSQGKIRGAVNSYCINVLGNWNGCGSCHVGLGEKPEPEVTTAQLENIDCLLCHQSAYRRTRVNGTFVPDVAQMTITMDEAARTVHAPMRENCLQCHAKAGGGDAVKRGDLTLAHGATWDTDFDVHMAVNGANLECQACHTFTDHRVAGKGSDLRPTDSDVRVECTNCHASMAGSGHEDEDIGRHTSRVGCQTCHIPYYAKDASDTVASEATETHRTWLETHGSTPPIHPASSLANDLVPTYEFWNGFSLNYLLGDTAAVDPKTGRYPTSRPEGGVDDDDSMLLPFKYKTAQQPMTTGSQQLIALDTSVFFATGDATAATRAGLVNMGLSDDTAYDWIETDTYQLLNHEVGTEHSALVCGDCHGSTERMNLTGELGYELKEPESQLCTSCHGNKEPMGFTKLHDKHVEDKKFDCSNCHNFSRPERGLRMP